MEINTQRFRAVQIRRRCGCLCGLITVMFLVLLGGCAAPLQTYSTDRPASISAGLRQAGVADGRRDFRSVFCSLLARDLAPAEARCDHWLVALSDEIIVSPPTAHALAPISPSVDIVFVGGIFGECLGERVELFGDAKQVIASAGYRTSAAPVRGRAGSDVNAEIIRSHILGLADSQRKILLIAYSKGASDALTALAQYPN